jgi:hypothetical protein
MEQVNAVVKANFNMDLNEFLKQKVEVESLYNYEIAALLDVEKTIVGKLIRQTGLKRKNGFIRRFESRYGKGSVDIFKDMVERLDTSLSDIARHFGFSREYARQAHLNLFGRPYTQTLYKKRTQKRLINEKAKETTRKSKAFNEFKQRLTTLGFSPQIFNERGHPKIVANGFKLAFRYSQRPHKVSGRWQFRITYLNSGNHRDCDFMICLCIHEEEKIYYILPNHIIPKHGVCFIPQADESESKYARYREAWDILFRPGTDMNERPSYNAGAIHDDIEDYPIWHAHNDMVRSEKSTLHGENLFSK